MKKSDKKKSFTDVLNEHLAIVETNTGNKMTLKNIAEYLGIAESTFSKKHHNQETEIPENDIYKDEFPFRYDVGDFTCNQLMKIVKFFNEHGDPSCTLLTLLYGDKVEEYGYEIPISATALNWLSKIGDRNPEYIKILNLLLSDDNDVGERLLSSFLFYCYKGIFKVESVELGYSGLNYDASNQILKMLALQHIASILDDVSEVWGKKYEHDKYAITVKARESRKKKNESGESEAQGQGVTNKETIKRLQTKQKANSRNKNGISSTAVLINTVQNLSSIPKRQFSLDDEYGFHVIKVTNPTDDKK